MINDMSSAESARLPFHEMGMVKLIFAERATRDVFHVIKFATCTCFLQLYCFLGLDATNALVGTSTKMLFWPIGRGRGNLPALIRLG